MTLERIKELRELESGKRDSDWPFPKMATGAEMLELLDAAEVLEVLENAKRSLIYDAHGWRVSGFAPSKPTPQTAVLAALRHP